MGVLLAIAMSAGSAGCGDDDGRPGLDAGGSADGGSDAAGAVDAGGCPAAEAPIATVLAGVSDVAHAAAGGAHLFVASASGGVTSFRATGCGALEPAATGLDGVVVTGLDVGRLRGTGSDVAAFDDARVLHALGGDDLAELWRASLTELSTAGAVVAAHLDGDADHDVAAFDRANGNLLRVENTGSGWMVRVAVALPAGITRVEAGELGGGGGRDEILFMGGGLVEVVSVADFDFSDVRFVGSGPHVAAAFGDFDGDGDGDALVASRATVELWSGDGAGAIAMTGTLDVAAFVLDMASVQRDPAGRVEAAALLDGGGVQIVRVGASGLEAGESADTGATAAHLLGDDLTGDGRADVVVVGSDGTAWVWRTAS